MILVRFFEPVSEGCYPGLSIEEDIDDCPSHLFSSVLRELPNLLEVEKGTHVNAGFVEMLQEYEYQGEKFTLGADEWGCSILAKSTDLLNVIGLALGRSENFKYLGIST